MNESYYEWDISPMGYREMYELSRLLSEYSNHPEGRDITKVGFNLNSGNVFLMDDDYTVWMMNGNNLKQFYTCSYRGNE